MDFWEALAWPLGFFTSPGFLAIALAMTSWFAILSIFTGWVYDAIGTVSPWGWVGDAIATIVVYLIFAWVWVSLIILVVTNAADKSTWL